MTSDVIAFRRRPRLRVALSTFNRSHGAFESRDHVTAPEGTEGSGEDPAPAGERLELVGPADQRAITVRVEVPLASNADREAGQNIRETGQLIGETRTVGVFGELFVDL